MKLPDQDNRMMLQNALERIQEQRSELLTRQEKIAKWPLHKREKAEIAQNLNRLDYRASALRERLSYTLSPQEQRERDLNEELRDGPRREAERALYRKSKDFWDRGR